MKKIGILFGQERSFPYALVDRINRAGDTGVTAEPMSVGSIGLETPRRYDLVLDRISQDIPFYRAVLKKLAFDGTIVVNDPFWWSADDKFFNNVIAKSVGVAVPKTVLLPSNQHPPDTTSESMSNLVFPLEWDEIFSHVGFPAYFKPHSGGGWKNVYRVANPDEFFAAYQASGQNVMILQEEIIFEEYFRCYVLGTKYVHLMRYDPRRPFHERYVRPAPPIEDLLEQRLRDDCLKLTGALGYEFDTVELAVRDGVPYAIDFLNPAPDADVTSIGSDNFEWVVETMAKWLVERVNQGPMPSRAWEWQKEREAVTSNGAAADRPTKPRSRASTRRPRRTRSSEDAPAPE
jgi:glutathione synthase/RimK-type ligase-like ATP-grasp enzyme